MALATGKLNPLVAAVAAAIPMLQRLSHAKSIFDRLRSAVSPLSQPTSVVSTSKLRVEINQQTGDWAGVVIAGRHAGTRLGSLSVEQLSELLDEYVRDDPESAQLLANYLQRRPGARGHRSGSRFIFTDECTDDKRAWRHCKCLGSMSWRHDQDIIAAHRRLMQKLHPDRGGSDYLASKINQAKDRLLQSRP